jgi:hypothetical protein
MTDEELEAVRAHLRAESAADAKLFNTKLYFVALWTMLISGALAIGIGIYNRITGPTWKWDIVSGILAAIAVICYMHKKDFDTRSRAKFDRIRSRG